MRYLAIDQSLVNSGVAYTLGGDTVELSSIKPPKIKGLERLYYIEAYLLELLDTIKPDVIILEGYAFGARGQVFNLGELGGMVRMIMNRWLANNVARPSLLVVAPASLKKFITGKGNSKKDVMLLATYKKFDIELSDDNQCDAYGLLKMAVAHTEGTVTCKGNVRPMLTYEAESVSSIENIYTNKLYKIVKPVRKRNR